MNKLIGLNGPGNDYRHQIIISYVIYELMKKFVEVKSYKNFVVVPELSLKPNSSKIPDITVRKMVRGIPTESVLLIEICNANKVNEDITKLLELMTGIASVKEAFVIDKDGLVIYKISRAKTNKPTKPKKDSKIEMFKLDLSKVLDVLYR